MIKASDLLVQALENEGIEYVFGLPGEENLDFLESLSKSSIKLITVRHEQAAGFMAATYGRLTDKPAVCLSTLGPGATNLMTSIAYSFLGGMPMIAITGQKPVKHSKQALFQILDIVEMMKPITKFSKQITHANNIPSLVKNAFRISMAEKPGPVHLELPEDIAAESIDRKPIEISKPEVTYANTQSIKNAYEQISKAKMPILVIGPGANRHGVFDSVREFILSSGIYFISTQMGKGVAPESSKQFLGTTSLSSDDFVHEVLAQSDLIITLGYDVAEKPAFLMNEVKASIVHINYEPAKIDDLYYPDYEVIGCLSSTMTDLAKKLSSYKYEDEALNILKEYSQIQQNIFHELPGDISHNSPQSIVRQVRYALPEDGIISLDNGLYKIWFARNFLANHPNSILLDNALASMGAGLPAAISAKLVYPDRKVMSVCGDGGFMMSIADLETAVRLKLDLVIVVLIDNTYGMIKWKQRKMDFKDYGLDFNNPDFCALAASYGAKGHTVVDGNLINITNKAFSEGGVHIIEMPIDYYASDYGIPEKLIDELVPKKSERIK